MKIKKLIELYEKAIPHYQKAIDEKASIKTLTHCSMTSGLCFYFGYYEHPEFCELFNHTRYYKNIIKTYGYLYDTIDDIDFKNYKPLINRVKFMKKEIIELNQLLKKGYTDV